MTEAGEIWGTLGEPEGESGGAHLVHVVHAEVATLRLAHYEAGAKVPYHRHDRATLVYGVGGPCVEACAREGMIKRRLTFHPAGWEHGLDYLGPTYVLSIDIHPDRPGATERWTWPSRSSSLPATFYDQIWWVLLAVAQERSPECVDLALRDLFHMVESFEKRSPPDCVLQVIDDVHSNWRSVPSMKELAARHLISPQYLCRAFKKYTGVTLQQYGLMLRLDHARGLLWWSGMTLSAVAAETGFADQSHLTRVLSAHSEETPRGLRWTAPWLRTPTLVGA